MHAFLGFHQKGQGKSRRRTPDDLNVAGFWLLQWLAMSNQSEPRQRIISGRSCLGKSCLARARLLGRDDAEVMTAGVTQGGAFDNNAACA
jgi:hypothetical protein